MRSFQTSQLFRIIFVLFSMQHTLRTQVSQRIKAILKEKGLKQQELADSAGMSKSYLSRIIHGTINPTIDTIEQLENALKTPILICPE